MTRTLAIVIVVLLGLLGLQTYRVSTAQTALALEQRDRKDERVRLVEAGKQAVENSMAELNRRVTVQQEVIHATQDALDAARDAADRVPDLDRRVRNATTALYACRRAAATDPAIAASSPPAEEAAGVLAELQRVAQAAEAARTRYADEAGAASERCAASYDTLTVSPGPAVVGAE